MDDLKKICSLEAREGTCYRAMCRSCGWSYDEIERRKKLPWSKNEYGLFYKYVGRTKRENNV